MIDSFGNQLAQDLYDDRSTRATRKFPPELHRIARRKLLYLHEADKLSDLKMPPGNRFEALKGILKEYHSIRVNDQWRVVFKWKSGHAQDVQVLDYHR